MMGMTLLLLGALTFSPRNLNLEGVSITYESQLRVTKLARGSQLQFRHPELPHSYVRFWVKRSGAKLEREILQSQARYLVIEKEFLAKNRGLPPSVKTG